MRDPTWADTLIAAILIIWALLVVFGGLAVLGLWLAGPISTHPGGPTLTWSQQERGKRRRKGSGPDAAASRPTNRPGEYIVSEDQDSSTQVLEDDREWHHDRRRSEGHDACPECGTRLTSAGRESR